MGRWLASPLLVGLAACVGPGLLTDGSSVSVGTHSRGLLRRGHKLPARGEGYVVPPRWLSRDRSYGTDELVSLILRAARRVERQHRNAMLGVADLSPRGGGPSPEHLSHRSGRDVDLIYYTTDLRGKPVLPSEMLHYDESGLSRSDSAEGAGGILTGAAAYWQRPPPTAEGPAGTPPPRRLDVQRTWALVRALVTDPEVHVQWIFIGRTVARQLLAHAQRINEPAWVVERAESLMHQPGDAQAHDDHVHVRVFCPLSDRQLGCVDRGPPRWMKKSLKYSHLPPFRQATPVDLQQLTLAPIRYPFL